MDTRILQSFVTSAEYANFSRAAVVLGIAQSVLSRHIATLEHDFGGRLFERTGRGVQLSELGKAMLPRAKALLTDVRSLYDAAAAERDVVKGDVSVGVVPAWTQRLVGPLTRTVVSRYPQVRLRIQEGYSGEVEKWVQTGEVDMGLWNVYGEHPDRRETISRADMFLVTRRGDPLTRHAELTLKSLRGLDFAMQARPNAFRSLLDSYCLKAGFSMSVKLETDSYVAIREAVVEGGLYGFFPIQTIAREVETGTLQVIRVVDPVLQQRTVFETTSARLFTLASRMILRTVLEIVRGGG